MEFSEEQKDIIRGWVKEGCGLSEIQKRLSGELGVTITYMEVRFLVLDLELDIKEDDKPEPPVKADESEASMPDPNAGESTPGGVQVEVDVLMRPGALLSGTVVFSDGVTAIWMLDQSGRLGIEPSQADYKPSEEDNAEFIKALQEEIAKKGL
jgi:hypothetical protein